MVLTWLSFHNSILITHNSNSNLITHNPNPTITQKLQNCCLVTKLNHISQLLSPLFDKMVEPTPLTLHKSYGCYPCQFSFSHFHILLSPSPPSMANSKPTTINTQWPQNGEKKSQPKENPTINYTQKKKNFPIINTTTNHTNPPPSQPKFQTTTTNKENLNTPTKNLQIDDPKLPTQTHKHRKPKSKPRNP